MIETYNEDQLRALREAKELTVEQEELIWLRARNQYWDVEYAGRREGADAALKAAREKK